MNESGLINWKTIEPLNYDSVRYKKHFVVPKDFETDLASVPHDLLAWFVAGGRGNAAAVLHDWLYRQGVKFKQIKTQEEADFTFYDAMLDCQVPAWRAWTMYQGVRYLGKGSFHKE
jgi:hypothetical protein